MPSNTNAGLQKTPYNLQLNVLMESVRLNIGEVVSHLDLDNA
jgi:hypothetical protein